MTEEQAAADQLRDIPLETVYWLEQTDVTEEQIRNMASSLAVHGQIEPIVVAERDERGYRGVIGRLRYEGMKYRWRDEPQGKTIQAKVRRFESEMQVKTWQLAENLHRREIPAMQRARQYRALYEALKKDHGEEATIQALATTIEDMTGAEESIKTIHHYLSLTKLEPKTQEILTSEKMPLRYGLELLRIKKPEKQVKLAQGIKDILTLAPTVNELKWRVDSVIDEERGERHDERLTKKAEQLRAETKKTVYLEGELSWEEKDKKVRSFKYTLTPMPEECGACPKLGIEVQRNFHQEPICTDPPCYEKKYEEKVAREHREQEESTREWRKEKAKVLKMGFDIRHWRLVVFTIGSAWELKNLLHMSGKEWEPGRDNMEKAVLEKVLTFNEEECKRLLVAKAVEEILTGPQAWRGDSPIKTWAVKEFGLKREVFLGKEETREVKVPCDTCINGGKCDRTKFYAKESGELTCDSYGTGEEAEKDEQEVRGVSEET